MQRLAQALQARSHTCAQLSRWQELIRRASRVVAKTLGMNITYHYKNGDSINLCAIKDFENEEVSLGVGINSSQLVFVVMREQLDRAPQAGDLITHDKVTHEVLSIIEDGITCYRIYCHAIDTRCAGHGDRL